MKIKQTLKKILTLFCASIILFSAAGCSCGVNGGGVTPLSFSFYSFEDFLAFHNEFSQKSNIAKSILAFDFDTDSTINKSYMITCNTVSEDNIKKHNLNKSNIAKFLNEQPKVFLTRILRFIIYRIHIGLFVLGIQITRLRNMPRIRTVL